MIGCGMGMLILFMNMIMNSIKKNPRTSSKVGKG